MYRVKLPTYYTEEHVTSMRFLLNNLNGVEVIREETSEDCINIIVKLDNEDVIECLQDLSDCDVFGFSKDSIEQTNLFG